MSADWDLGSGRHLGKHQSWKNDAFAKIELVNGERRILINKGKIPFDRRKTQSIFYSEKESYEKILTVNLGDNYSGHVKIPEPVNENLDFIEMWHQPGSREDLLKKHLERIGDDDLKKGS